MGHHILDNPQIQDPITVFIQFSIYLYNLNIHEFSFFISYIHYLSLKVTFFFITDMEFAKSSKKGAILFWIHYQFGSTRLSTSGERVLSLLHLHHVERPCCKWYFHVVSSCPCIGKFLLLNILVQCMVPQIFNLRPHLLKSIVHVIRFITNRKYAFCCVF